MRHEFQAQPLGDLPDDIGTDHNQLIDVPAHLQVDLEPPRRKRRIPVPAWVVWLARALIPQMLPALNFIGRKFTIGTQSDELLGSNSGRRSLLIQNNSGASMYVNFDNDAAPGSGVKIPPGGNYEPLRVPMNSIHLAGDTAGLTGFLVEG